MPVCYTMEKCSFAGTIKAVVSATDLLTYAKFTILVVSSQATNE